MSQRSRDAQDGHNHKSHGSKGFLSMLALCLIAIGGVAVMTFADTRQTVQLAQENTTQSLATTTITTMAAPANVAPAASQTTTSTTVTTTSTTASSLFVLPLSNMVINPYSDKPVYNDTMKDFRAHPGTDFDGEEDQPIRALAAGTVIDIQEDPLWGGCLTLDHGNDVTSVYRGIRADVQIGDELSVGDPLGAVAQTPCELHLGPHLHLELYQNGQTIDPTTLLKGQLTEQTQ